MVLNHSALDKTFSALHNQSAKQSKLCETK